MCMCVKKKENRKKESSRGYERMPEIRSERKSCQYQNRDSEVKRGADHVRRGVHASRHAVTQLVILGFSFP